MELYKQNALNPRTSIEKRLKALYQFLSLKDLDRYFSYWKVFERNINKAETVKQSNCVFFFVNEYSLINATFALPLLIEAVKRGYLCIPTSPRMFAFEKYEDNWLNSFAGTITGDMDLRYEAWLDTREQPKIDLEKRIIEIAGFNCYEPIFEFVSRYQFTYKFNYQSDAWARRRANMLIRTFDRLFAYIEEVEEWVIKNEKKVYFISNAPHLHNAAAFRIYCENAGYQNGLNFICINSGYDNYFKNIGDSKTETLTALNMTKNLQSRNSFLGTSRDFESYYKEHIKDYEIIKDKAQRWLNYRRGNDVNDAKMTSKKIEIREQIEMAKRNGKRIYVLVGKVIFDLGVKYIKGIVHDDMSDWITHTVEIVKEDSDALLLIKPHPHERREDLVLTNEKIDNLSSLIRTNLSENIIYLDSDMFQISELAPYIDLGLVWNGSSALELAAQKIPVLVADVWGHYDYPIGFLKPKDINEYEYYFKNPKEIKDLDLLQKRAIMFLNYMGSENVRITNQYTKTASLNFHQFDSFIYEKEIDHLIQEGDKQLERLFDKIL